MIRDFFRFAILLTVAATAAAQITVTPPATPISLSSPAPFTFTVDLPSGGTAINWGSVRFYQTPSAAPSSTTPWCGFNIFPTTDANGVNGVGLTVYNADATVPVNLWLPNLWTTAAQRSNSFCSVAAENQIIYTINAAKTSLTVTVPRSWWLRLRTTGCIFRKAIARPQRTM